MTRPGNAWAPVYRVLLKSRWRGENVPTCVVAGPNRHRAWLYVHAATPTVLRLHPEVVRFLRAALAELATGPADASTACWRLRRRTDVSYPECTVIQHDAEAWLHVHAATPSGTTTPTCRRLPVERADRTARRRRDVPPRSRHPRSPPDFVTRKGVET